MHACCPRMAHMVTLVTVLHVYSRSFQLCLGPWQCLLNTPNKSQENNNKNELKSFINCLTLDKHKQESIVVPRFPLPRFPPLLAELSAPAFLVASWDRALVHVTEEIPQRLTLTGTCPASHIAIVSRAPMQVPACMRPCNKSPNIRNSRDNKCMTISQL